MKLIPLFIVALFLIFITPVSATPHDDAKTTAQVMINDLADKLPYTAEFTANQIAGLGVEPDHVGKYKFTIKSASYDADKGQAVLYINAWRDTGAGYESIKVNNPARFYLPFNGGISGNGAKRMQTAAAIIIRYLDVLPLGQPVNDDTVIIYAANDGELTQTSSSATWQVLRDGLGNAVSNNPTYPYLVYLTGHASTADTWVRMRNYGLNFNTTLPGTVTSATLRLKYYTKLLSISGQNETAVVIFNPANSASFVAGDYNEWNAASPTELAPRYDYSTKTSGDLNFTFNAAGISAINTAGNTTLYLMDGDQVDNALSGSWVASSGRLLRIYGGSDATESNRPFGVFVYTPGGGDTTPPLANTNFANTTNCNQSVITYDNSTSLDFNHSVAYWDNVPIGWLPNTTDSVTRTGLSENTEYTLSTSACDFAGNCNTTVWGNHTIKTGFCGVAPVAAFSANNLTVCQGTNTQFTDASTNGPLTWDWTFGDGNTSTLQNPLKTYDVIGLMTVNLTANNTYGFDSEVKPNYINVTACIIPPTPTPTPTPAPQGCIYTNITTDIDENTTEWQAHEGNYTWGTLIVNRTLGNISYYSCYATPTQTPAPTWQPEINPPSPDNIFGTIKNWIKEWLKDVFT